MSTSVRSRMRTTDGLGEDPEPAVRRAIAAGEHRRALVLLMDAHGATLLRYCERMLGDLDRARDVRQVVFLQAYRGLAGYAGRGSLRAWLFGIARHRCLDELKSARHRRHESLDAEEHEPHSLGPDDERAWAVHRAILRCLENLDVHVRDAILLRCQDGFSFPELSRMLGEQAGTIQARVARGSARLRRCLSGHGVRP